MPVLTTAVLAAEEGGHIVNELPFPGVLFGVIVLTIFIVFAIVTFSFRDVANRHSEKAEAFAREHGETPQHH